MHPDRIRQHDHIVLAIAAFYLDGPIKALYIDDLIIADGLSGVNVRPPSPEIKQSIKAKIKRKKIGYYNLMRDDN
ncbi:MAG: hypothetical protein ACM3QV_00185 [Caulobacteraceae bacterium]